MVLCLCLVVFVVVVGEEMVLVMINIFPEE